MELLAGITIIVSGLMVGNELTVALFLHPTLNGLRDGVHAQTVQAFAKLFGRVMPFWYAVTAILTLILALLDRQNALLISSAAVWIFAIIYTVIFPVPINNRISSWDQSRLPVNWKRDRQQWDRYHRIRVVILLVAFAV